MMIAMIIIMVTDPELPWEGNILWRMLTYTDTLYKRGHCQTKFEFKYWLWDMNAVKAEISGTGWFEICVKREVTKRSHQQGAPGTDC
jgi:hypothetical protein